jgi:hypothetical protein
MYFDQSSAGTAAIVLKLEATVAVMKRKSYDWLDHQHTQFDTDFEEFQQQIEELHVSSYFSNFFHSTHYLMSSSYDVVKSFIFLHTHAHTHTRKSSHTVRRDLNPPAIFLCL